MRMLHVKGWGWLEGDTKWTSESPAKKWPRVGMTKVAQGRDDQKWPISLPSTLLTDHYIFTGLYWAQ